MKAHVSFSFLVDFRRKQQGWAKVDNQMLSSVLRGPFCGLSFELPGIWSCIYGQSEYKANGLSSDILQSSAL